MGQAFLSHPIFPERNRGLHHVLTNLLLLRRAPRREGGNEPFDAVQSDPDVFTSVPVERVPVQMEQLLDRRNVEQRWLEEPASMRLWIL